MAKLSKITQKFWLIFVWSMLLCCGGVFGGEDQSFGSSSSTPFQMEVFLRKPLPQVYALLIRITNSGPTIREIESLELPWIPYGIDQSVKITRLDKVSSPVARGGSMINYGGSQSIPLQPGESIEGNFILNESAPTLLQDIKKFGVKIHWLCSVPFGHLPVTCPQGKTGAFVIPYGDPGMPDPVSIDQDNCEQSRKNIKITQANDKWEHLSVHTDLATIQNRENRMKFLQTINRFVKQCKPRWTSSWEASFFNQKEFAGFPSDPKNKAYFEQGLWQKAHIGEYVARTRRFIYFPLIWEDRIEEYLSLYQLDK